MSNALLEIVTFAAGVVGRDLAPGNSLTRSVAQKAARPLRARWQDKKALDELPNLPKPHKHRRRRPRLRPGPFTMYDAVTPTNIPRNAVAVAGYVDGDFITVPALRKLFRGPVRLWGLLRPVELITITVFASVLDAQVLDVENGDATPQQAVQWALAKIRRGEIPKLYANRYTMQSALWPLLAAAGIKRAQVVLWVADWTKEPHIPPGYDACQWHGGLDVGYDISLCESSFLR